MRSILVAYIWDLKCPPSLLYGDEIEKDHDDILLFYLNFVIIGSTYKGGINSSIDYLNSCDLVTGSRTTCKSSTNSSLTLSFG